MRFKLVVPLLTWLFVAGHAFATSEEDYEKALTAYNQVRYDEAFIHLKNSLKQDPNNLAAKILMGKILLVNGYLAAAETEFFEALDQGADINLVAEPLGNALLFQNKYEKVVNFNETELLVDQQRIKWLQIRASACIRLNQFVCATDAYKDSLKLNPEYHQAYNGLASVALFQEEYPEAKAFLEKSFALATDDATTWRLKGQLARANQDYDSAIEFLQAALKLAPNDPNTLRKLADLYLESNDFDSARAFVDEIIEKTPNDPLAILLSSWLESKDKEKLVSNERLEQLNEIMSSLSPEVIAEQPVLLYISGLTAYFHGNTEQAANNFTQYLLKKPNDVQAIILLAKTYLMTQQNRQALTLLEKHENKLIESIDSALLLGDLYLKQNRAFKAQKLSDELVVKYPNNSRVKLFRIRLMATRGRTDEALAILDNSYQANKSNPTFLFTYSMMKLQANEYADALNSSDALLTLYPDDPEFMNLKAGILIRLQRYTEALDLLDITLAKNPDLFAAKFNKAAILSRLEDFAASNQIIEALLAVSPKHPQSLLLKAHNRVQEGDVEEALSLYSDLLVLNSDFTYARFELAKLYQAIRDYDQAIYHVERLLLENFDNPNYLLFKASLYIQKRNILEAKKTLSVVEHFTKDSVEFLFRQSDLQKSVGDMRAALASLNAALKLDRENPRIQLEKVRLLIDLEEYKQANQLLKGIKSKNADNPNFWLVNALYNDAVDDRQQATQDLIEALSLDIDFHQALVLLYEFALRGGDKPIFVTQANNVINNAKDGILAKNLLAQYYFIQRDFEQASQMYKSLLADNATFNRPNVYNKLAIMALESDLSQAETYIWQAFELNDSNPDVLDTLGWVLVRKGSAEEGLGYLRKAYARDSNNPEIRYHLGYALAQMGRSKEAIVELEQAVAAQRPFFNRSKAQELLDTLI